MAEPSPKPNLFSGLMDLVSSLPSTFWYFLLVIIVGFIVWSTGFTSVFILLIVTIVAFKIAWELWLHYVRQNFMAGIDYVLLEIIPPRDVLRSPKAMELFFTNALYHWSNKGGLEKYWQGAIWFWYSLELVSIEGQVHFYIRTPTRLKELIETQMYAQYPQAQVKVVEDYTLAVSDVSEESGWKLWGCEFELEQPEFYPIKTYVDFGLDKDPKEEYKVDPISPVIELFAALKKGEQMWCQIVVRPSKKEYHTKGTWFGKHDWVKEAEIELDRLLEDYKTPSDTAPNRKGRPAGFAGTDPRVKGISSKINKLAFDTGIRVCYVARKEAWDMNNRRNIRLIFRQYTNPFVNGLRRTNATQADSLGGGGFLGSFFLLSDKKVEILCNRMLNEYRTRSFFHSALRNIIKSKLPWPISPTFILAYFDSPVFVLNVEELATLWHFPGQILKVPTLERIESKEASPPTNLPT